MECYCCGTAIPTGRKVKIRPWRHIDRDVALTNTAAYMAYVEELTYRWSVICQACYSTLDNEIGLAEISGRLFNIAGASRGDKATTIDEAKYHKFRRLEAEKLGIVLDEEQ